jgi:hypothetical protein
MISQVTLPLSLITIEKVLHNINNNNLTLEEYIQISRILINMYKYNVLKTHISNSMTGEYVDYNRQLFIKSEKIMSLCIEYSWIKLFRNTNIPLKVIYNIISDFKKLRKDVHTYNKYLCNTTKINPHIYNYISGSVDYNLEIIIEKIEEEFNDKCVYEWIKSLRELSINPDTNELRDTISITELKDSFIPFKYDLDTYIPKKITLYIKGNNCSFPYNIPNYYNNSSIDKKEYSGIMYNCKEELLDLADYIENYNKGDIKEQTVFFGKQVSEYLQQELYIPYYCVKHICNTYKKQYNTYEGGLIKDIKTIIDWHGLILYIRNTLANKKFIMRYISDKRYSHIKCLDLL